jgi:hypothetical protein
MLGRWVQGIFLFSAEVLERSRLASQYRGSPMRLPHVRLYSYMGRPVTHRAPKRLKKTEMISPVRLCSAVITVRCVRMGQRLTWAIGAAFAVANGVSANLKHKID